MSERSPFILTSCSDACGNVGYSHSTLSCVSMLATRSPSSKSLNSEIRLINLHMGWCVTQDWYYSHCCKRSVSALGAIKWRNSYQPVDSYFCFGIPKCIFTINFDCCPLNKDLLKVSKLPVVFWRSIEIMNKNDFQKKGKKLWNSIQLQQAHVQRLIDLKKKYALSSGVSYETFINHKYCCCHTCHHTHSCLNVYVGTETKHSTLFMHERHF